MLVHKIATFNVHYMTKMDQIGNLLRDTNVDVCGMQEVAGLQSLKKFIAQFPEFSGVFDDCYKTYGNGLVFNNNKFELVSKKTHILTEGTRSKKSAFEVSLRDLHSRETIKFVVMHLNHRWETSRLNEWKKYKSLTLEEKNVFILGDFNALTKKDYTDDEWESICNTRTQNKWEAPQTALTDQIEMDGFIDLQYQFCNSKNEKPKPTSRFNTRIDYLFCKSDNNVEIMNAECIQTNASDHSLVTCEILFN